MAQLFSILSSLVSIYMLIIFIRIVLSWFSGIGRSGFQDILARITDPYLNWFRRFSFLRVGFLDLSPIVALGVLSLVNRILGTLAVYKTITLGIILAMVLQGIWAAVSFFLGFLIVVLILCLVAHLARLNTNGPFWRFVQAISQPVIFKITRIFVKDRILDFTVSVIISIVCLGISYFALRILVDYGSMLLARLPF